MLTVRQALLTIMAVCVAIFVLFMSIRPAPAGEPDDWWHLTISLHAQMDRINNEPDRAFLRQMVNALAVASDAVPTAAQQKWLLSIQHELDRQIRRKR